MNAVCGAVLATVRLAVGGALILSVLLICANAAGRYLFLSPIIWAEEILGYVLVWSVYLGAILVTWDGGHLKVDLLSRFLPGPLRALVNGIAALGFVAVGVLIVWQAKSAIAEFHYESLVAELPMDVVHTVIPFAFGMMVLVILVRWRLYLAGAPAGSEIGDGTRP